MTAPHSDALVLFGATGDLADKKTFPALYRAGETRRSEGSGHRRRLAELGSRGPARSREGQHHSIR
jgi:glucose-6-phosphate 1-dehydrogenase